MTWVNVTWLVDMTVVCVTCMWLAWGMARFIVYGCLVPWWARQARRRGATST
jgi:hypothetical protein